MRSFADILLERILQRTQITLLVLSIFALAVGYGAANLTYNDDHRSYFSDQDPYKIAYEELEKEYTASEYLLLVITPQQGPIFQRETLDAIEDITDRAWRLPYVLRSDSITNYQYSRALGDDIIVSNLYSSDEPISDAEIGKRSEFASTNIEIVNRTLSPDARVAAVILTSQAQDNRSEKHYQLAQSARQLKQELNSDYPELDIRLSGNIMMPAAMRDVSDWDAKTLMPIMIALILLIVYLLMRSVVATLGVFLVVVFANVIALGFAGWVDIQLSAISSAAMSIIMILAVADCVHILTSFFQYLAQGNSQQEALRLSVRSNMKPIFLTSVTTAIGLLVFNFNESPQFQNLGNITVIGVLAAWLFSWTLLPAFINCFNFESTKTKLITAGLSMSLLAEFVIQHRKSLLPTLAIVNLLILGGIALNKTDDHFIRYVGEKIEFRQDAEYVMSNLTGLNIFNYSIPSGKSNGINDPEYLKKLNSLVNWLREQPEVVQVDAITDVYKRLNKNMHGEDPTYYRLPESAELAAQYMLLYEFSLPFGIDLNDRINIDKSNSRLVVTLSDLTSTEMLQVEKRIFNWIQGNTPKLQAIPSGPAIMFSHISERTIKSMISGTLLGFVLIAAILCFALRSVRYGILSLLPNLLPAGLAFGLWGIFVGQVSMAVSVVLAMTLGIVVDDTVHFLHKYLHFKRNAENTSAEAIKYTFESVGLALTITSVALFAGFVVLGFSQFEPNALLARMTAMAIALALLIDFLLLPPILLLMDRK